MAKGNNGNYLQHSVEVEAAVHLTQSGHNGGLHVALTHGMAPFERLDKPCGNAYCFLYDALREAAGEARCDDLELVKAYRASWKSQEYSPDIADLCKELKREKRYPNSAELLRAVIGTERLSGGITETDPDKHKDLAMAWAGSGITVCRSSWHEQLGENGVLRCPDRLKIPWLFSMDPMTYTENRGKPEKDDKLHRSDLVPLVRALERYVGSGQPGIASLFVYGVGSQRNGRQCQFWAFMDDLAQCLSMCSQSYWITHRGGNRNLAGLLFSNGQLAVGFSLPEHINSGRGK